MVTEILKLVSRKRIVIVCIAAVSVNMLQTGSAIVNQPVVNIVKEAIVARIMCQNTSLIYKTV